MKVDNQSLFRNNHISKFKLNQGSHSAVTIIKVNILFIAFMPSEVRAASKLCDLGELHDI